MQVFAGLPGLQLVTARHKKKGRRLIAPALFLVVVEDIYNFL